MKIVNLVQEDFTNYKKTSMFIGFPKCTGKCNKLNGAVVCQNAALYNSKTIEVAPEKLVALYLANPLVKALVLGGLEPFDSPEDLMELVGVFRRSTNDDIVIYTGYTEQEVKNMVAYGFLLNYSNVVIKYGRYLQGDEPHMDDVLGVKLASNNQYARIIS